MTDLPLAVRWRALADDGLEHCALKVSPSGVTAEAVIIAGRAAEAFALRYRITLEPELAGVRSLHLTLLGGPTVALRHDGEGGWSDSEGRARADLLGCLDLDLAASPLGLSASIRRQAWKPGKALHVDVVAIAAPSLAIERQSRTLTCVEPGRLYRLEAPGVDAVDLALGADGLVERLGDRFERVAG